MKESSSNNLGPGLFFFMAACWSYLAALFIMELF